MAMQADARVGLIGAVALGMFMGPRLVPPPMPSSEEQQTAADTEPSEAKPAPAEPSTTPPDPAVMGRSGKTPDPPTLTDLAPPEPTGPAIVADLVLDESPFAAGFPEDFRTAVETDDPQPPDDPQPAQQEPTDRGPVHPFFQRDLDRGYYVVRPGDTLESIAWCLYLDETRAETLRELNPQADAILAAGTRLELPR